MLASREVGIAMQKCGANRGMSQVLLLLLLFCWTASTYSVIGRTEV